MTTPPLKTGQPGIISRRNLFRGFNKGKIRKLFALHSALLPSRD